MKKNHCLAHCTCTHAGRREFIKKTSLVTAGSLLLGQFQALAYNGRYVPRTPRSCGQASRYVPVINAAFVRRKEEYGMLWPGAVYDGESARNKYADDVTKAAEGMGLKFNLRPAPLYSLEEAAQWLEDSAW